MSLRLNISSGLHSSVLKEVMIAVDFSMVTLTCDLATSRD